jgi:Carboxypeptidase regulatory-like domain
VKLNHFRSALPFLILLGAASIAFGQEATIVGSVTDPTGAFVPNAEVTITDTDTNLVHQITSNESGEFVVPNLQIGHYTVRVQAAGFKAIEQNDIKLSVGDRDRLDFKLEVGSTQESINVEAAAVAVQSESSEVSDVITGQQVSQLATNGRSMYSLATLTAGASSNMSDLNIPTSTGGDATVSFNGMRQSHNLYLVDGGEAADRGGAGGMDIMPSVDAIAEFRALTSNYTAEYGLSSSATMTMAFKSGTKDFHASAWEFLRNDALDAGNYFTNAAGQKAPELRFNTYGFNVGGPVFIPKVYNKNREKTFFFYNMEWRKLVQGGLTNQTVPNTSEYGGQFPGSVAIHSPAANQMSAALQAKYAAAGIAPGAAFPGNRIPTSLLDPNAQALLAAGIFPAATSGTQFIGGNKLPTNLREEIVRIDHRFSDKFWIFGHWVDEQVSQTYGTSIWSGDNVPTVGDNFTNPAYHGVIHAVNSISPTVLNEVAFNYNGNRIGITPTGIYKRTQDINIPELFPGNTLNRIPGVQLSGSTGAQYDVNSWPWNNKADDYQIRDDISWTKGAHQLKFGVSWALYKKVQDLFGNTQGSFVFDGAYTGNDFADFLLGYSKSYTELAVQDKGYWNNISPAAYIQDNWKATPRLTINLGLRWDGIPHTYEAHNRMSNFYSNLYNPADAAILLPNGTISPNSPGLGTSPNPILNGYLFYLNGIGIAGKNGIPKGLVKDAWLNFGPRVGLAYDLTGSGKTVLRGGFGIMYERIQGNDMYNAGPNIPFSSSVTFNNVSLSNPNASILTGSTLAAPVTVSSITGLAYSDYKSPASYQYSFGIQREVWANSVLSVAYVGNQSRHQNDYRDVNLPATSVLPSLIAGTVSYNTVLPYAGFNSIKLSENAQNAHYNGLQVELHAKIARDLTLQTAYTLSRAVDPATSTGGGDLYTVSNPYNRAYDNGPSGLDRTHIGLVNFIYEVPFFRTSSNRFLRTSVGGWEVSGIVTMQSGLPLNITLGGSQGSNGLANGTNRPDVNGNVSYPQKVLQFFDTAAFSSPAPGAWGSLQKGAIRGPGRDNWNISLFKNFLLSESRNSRFELRIETFNTFNHTQFKDVSSSFSSSNFGQVTSTWDPRVFQLGGKLIF